MQASIHVSREPSVQYLLRIGDTCLILAQRLAEWCGHAPIARGGHRPDEHGARPGRPGAGGADPRRQARGRARRRAARRGPARLPARRARLPQPHAGRAAARRLRGHDAAQLALATFLKLLWTKLERSSDAELAGIAGKAIKEARYHQQHAADWVVRLGDGTDESAARMKAALDSALALLRRDLRDRRGRRAGRRLGPGPALVRPARRLARRDRRRPRRGGPGPAGRAAVPQHRQARRAQRAHGLHPGRDAAPAARLSRRRVVSARGGRARALEQAWAVLDRVLDPEVPALSVRDLGIVRDVLESDDGADRRRHAHLFGLPGHRGDRAEHRRRARRRGPRPGAGRDAPRAGLDHRLDEREGRRKLREYGIAPPGPVAAPATAPLRFVPRQPPKALACPRCESLQHRAALRLRLHRLQGALALPRLPRAVRAFQADLTTSRP